MKPTPRMPLSNASTKTRGSAQKRADAVAKTLLAILPRIDEYCESIKKVNLARAIGSRHSEDNTLALMERIIDSTFQADRMRNLKIKIMRQLDAMPKRQGNAVKLYYLKGKEIPQIAAEFGVTERSAWRHVGDGVGRLTKSLDSMNVDSSTFTQLISQHKWIRMEFDRQISAVNE